MLADSLEGLHSAQEVPAVEGLCPAHPKELEKLLAPTWPGGHNGAGGLAGLQREEPLL